MWITERQHAALRFIAASPRGVSLSTRSIASTALAPNRFKDFWRARFKYSHCNPLLPRCTIKVDGAFRGAAIEREP